MWVWILLLLVVYLFVIHPNLTPRASCKACAKNPTE